MSSSLHACEQERRQRSRKTAIERGESAYPDASILYYKCIKDLHITKPPIQLNLAKVQMHVYLRRLLVDHDEAVIKELRSLCKLSFLS